MVTICDNLHYNVGQNYYEGDAPPPTRKNNYFLWTLSFAKKLK